MIRETAVPLPEPVAALLAEMAEQLTVTAEDSPLPRCAPPGCLSGSPPGWVGRRLVRYRMPDVAEQWAGGHAYLISRTSLTTSRQIVAARPGGSGLVSTAVYASVADLGVRSGEARRYDAVIPRYAY